MPTCSIPSKKDPNTYVDSTTEIEWRDPPPSHVKHQVRGPSLSKASRSASSARQGGDGPIPKEAPQRASEGVLGASQGTLVGSALPRIATARPAGISMGEHIIKWSSDVLAVQLLPWQCEALVNGCVQDSDGIWCSRTVGIMVGRQNGKTLLVAVRALAGMALWGEDVLAASQNRDVAMDAWNVALELAEESNLGVHSVSRTNGREAFHISKARYKVVSSTRRGGRGLSADLVIMDEVREYRSWEGWAALEKTRRARVSSQCWAISNEGDDGSIVLCQLAEAGRTAAQTGAATDAAWMEWSAPPDAMRSDPEAWAAANPAMGYLIPASTIESESKTDDPDVFETEVMCRRVASLRPWLAAGLWEACEDPYIDPPVDGADVVFALEAGPEHRHATIAVAHKRPDGRIFVESINGYQASDGDVLPRAALRLSELCERWKPLGVYVVDRSHAQSTARRVLEALDVPVHALNGADQVRAAATFHEAVVARQLVHAGDRMTGAHLGSLTADGVLRRRSAGMDVDAAVAVVLAVWGAVHSVARAPAHDWVAF